MTRRASLHVGILTRLVIRAFFRHCIVLSVNILTARLVAQLKHASVLQIQAAEKASHRRIASRDIRAPRLLHCQLALLAADASPAEPSAFAGYATSVNRTTIGDYRRWGVIHITVRSRVRSQHSVAKRGA
jgi:hypothetical protein